VSCHASCPGSWPASCSGRRHQAVRLIQYMCFASFTSLGSERKEEREGRSEK